MISLKSCEYSAGCQVPWEPGIRSVPVISPSTSHPTSSPNLCKPGAGFHFPSLAWTNVSLSAGGICSFFSLYLGTWFNLSFPEFPKLSSPL